MISGWRCSSLRTRPTPTRPASDSKLIGRESRHHFCTKFAHLGIASGCDRMCEAWPSRAAENKGREPTSDRDPHSEFIGNERNRAAPTRTHMMRTKSGSCERCALPTSGSRLRAQVERVWPSAESSARLLEPRSRRILDGRQPDKQS